jgi:hypothetical protein
MNTYYGIPYFKPEPLLLGSELLITANEKYDYSNANILTLLYRKY